MRRCARFLRKLADFIDPRVKPSEVFSIRIECDSTDFQAQLKKLTKQVEKFKELWP